MFPFSTSCHKNAKAATVPLGHTQVNGTSGARTPHHSLEGHRAGLAGGGVRRGAGCVFPCSPPQPAIHPHTGISLGTQGGAMVSRHFWGPSASVSLGFAFYPDPVFNSDPQFILLLNNSTFSHLQK